MKLVGGHGRPRAADPIPQSIQDAMLSYNLDDDEELPGL
jgi:hypothetical protein